MSLYGLQRTKTKWWYQLLRQTPLNRSHLCVNTRNLDVQLLARGWQKKTQGLSTDLQGILGPATFARDPLTH